MTVFVDISAALDGRLNTMSSLPPVAWQNFKYEPVNGTLYLRPTLLPAETTASTLGTIGTDENSGIYQVDIFAPSDTGKGEAYTMADSVADHFKPVTEIDYSGITVRCVSVSIGSTSQADGWFQVPVFVRYLALTTKR